MTELGKGGERHLLLVYSSVNMIFFEFFLTMNWD
jgi:hypothetical protein